MQASYLKIRVAGLSLAVVLHTLALAGFLGQLKVGTFVTRTSEPHSSELPHSSLAVTVSILSTRAQEELSSKQTGHLGGSFRVRPRLAAVEVVVPDFDIPLAQEANSVPVVSYSSPGSVVNRCEVHIHQSPLGEVQAVDLGECTGDSAWQRVLLDNIQRAAKLVSPSPGEVYPAVRTFTLRSDSLAPVALAQELSDIKTTEHAKAAPPRAR